jgi:Raf kinase inhibitor-like YbhB/YbcL family protein
MSIAVSSSAFEEGKSIPSKHTCDGADVSPPLTLAGLPAETRALALIMDDPDAPGGDYVHWVLYGMPAGTTALVEGAPPAGARQGRNDFGKTNYGGPCPPPGKPHRYYFKVYALDAELTLADGASKKDLLNAMKGHILAEGQLMGTYQRAR